MLDKENKYKIANKNYFLFHIIIIIVIIIIIFLFFYLPYISFHIFFHISDKWKDQRLVKESRVYLILKNFDGKYNAKKIRKSSGIIKGK